MVLALAPGVLWAPGLDAFVPHGWWPRMTVMFGAWALLAASFALDRIDREDLRRKRGLDQPTALNLNKN